MAYDYVIIGAGSAGCVLASRLSEDPAISVLLIEAGGRDRHPLIHIPVGFLRLLDHPKLTWRYRTAPDPDSGDRPILFPAGRGLGGSSSINGLLYIRGQPEDYDHWAQLGNRGWSFDDVLPYFKRSESWKGPPSPWRGTDGPLTVDRLSEGHPLCEAMVAAGQELGLTYRDDINAVPHDGIGYYQQTRRGRFRASAARAYLAPAMRRTNLRIMTGARVRHLIVDDGRVSGVAVDHRGDTRVERAGRETIVAAGTVGSPALLQRSGVGDPDHLERIGVQVRHPLPGVGRNLQDHYVVRVTCRVRGIATLNETARGFGLLKEALKYGVTGHGALTYSAALVGAFATLGVGSATPDVQYVIAPGSFRSGRLGELDDFPGLTVGCWQMRPSSRGYVRIASPSPDDAPEIRPRYLSDPVDRQLVVAGLRFARRLCGTDALKPFHDGEVVPGAEVASDEELLTYARNNGSTVYHAVGTCKMGVDDTAVVDSELRIRGLDGVRVVDASVMPTVTSTNTNATTIMIAEKAADLLRG